MKRPSNDNQAAIKPLNIAARTKIFSETELQRSITDFFHGYDAGRNLDCACPRGPSPSPPIPVAVNSKGLWVGCPIVRASDEHCFIVRVLRARETVLPLYPLSSFCPPNLACRNLTGGADLGAHHLSFCLLSRVARLVSNCARPTRVFRDRALREQRRLTGYPSLPTPGEVSGRTA